MNDEKLATRMSGGSRLKAIFVAALALEIVLSCTSGSLGEIGGWLRHVGGETTEAFFAWCVLQWVYISATSLFAGGALAAVGLAFRHARGAASGSARDPVIQVRDFFRRHAVVRAIAAWLPILMPLRLVLQPATPSTTFWFVNEHVAGALALLVVGSASALVNLFALRSLDRIRDRHVDVVTTVDRDETTFQAVAVTARSTGAVVAMVAMTIAMIYGVSQAHHFWMRDALHGLPLVGYAIAALGFAAWFRKASTIAVGRDGIFVRGTSKERFFSYQDFDEVRLAGMHFDFHRAGKRVLRLQLHGTDDARADALAERIRAALAASRRTDGAHLLARTAHSGSLGRAVQGASDYRQPSVSREQLWELVEGEATDREARLAAATALAGASDAADRTRIRVAAAHVADPRARIALEDVADHVDDDGAGVATRAETALRLPIRAS